MFSLMSFVLVFMITALAVSYSGYYRKMEVNARRATEISHTVLKVKGITDYEVENKTLENIKLQNIENALRDTCRTAWLLGKANNCPNADTVQFTWAFLNVPFSGNLGDLIVQLLPNQSDTFSCTTAQQYEAYRFIQSLGGITSVSEIPSYFYGIEIDTDSIFNPPAGYTDPCGFAEFFFRK